MFSLVKPVGELLRIKQIDIYNNVFKLHSKLTVALFLIFSICVSAYEYFGSPIDCTMGESRDLKFVNNICWINGTYTIKDLKGELGVHMVSYGVNSKVTTPNERKYQRYYQWIAMVLIIQAVLFYMPAFFWKIWEHGRIRQLCKNLDSPLIPEDYIEQKKSIIKYLLADNKQAHTIYAFRFFICEAMNFAVVMANIYLLHFLFSGFWLEYAPAIGAIFSRNWSDWNRYNARVFPKLAKCEYSTFGPSGSPQIKDAMCLLSLNILNEKIFAFQWMWIGILFLISGINLIYRTFIMICTNFRIQLLRSLVLPMTLAQVKSVTNDGNVGDWFILYQLGRNLNPYAFKEIIEELAEIRRNRSKKIDLYA